VRASNDAGSSAATWVPTAVVSAKPAPTVSVTLDVIRSIVVYGVAVELSVSISSGEAGQQVTIMEHRSPFGRAAQVRELATVKRLRTARSASPPIR
jgi:hypothetical protein